jgi:hypothetical protein
MVDFNGSGGLAGFNPFGGGLGSNLSAGQVNASMGLTPGGADQSTLNNIFGNFGQQTDYYSGLGAAYGRATGGFGGTSQPTYNPYDPATYTPSSGGGYFGGGIGSDAARAPDQPGNIPYNPSYLPGGGLNPNDPGNISEYYRLMGGGGGIGSDAARAPNQPGNNPYAQRPVDWDKYFTDMTGSNSGQGGIGSDIARSPNQLGLTPQQFYVGGYDPYNTGSYAQSAQQNVGGQGYTPAYLPGGGLNPNDPGNIAEYNRIMGGGIGSDAARAPSQNFTPGGQGGIGSDALRDQFAWQLAQSSPYAENAKAPSMPDMRLLGYDPNRPLYGGSSNAPPYQGNPFYMPPPMAGQQPVPEGGGFGAPGFGPYGASMYSGQPGYGLDIGTIGSPVTSPFYNPADSGNAFR